MSDVSPDPAAAPSQELPTSGRQTDGTFAPGNLFALRHGRFSRQVQAGELPEQAELRAALDERVLAIVSDMGGPDVVSVLARDAVSRYVALQLIEDWLMGNVIGSGCLTPKGRQRAALSALLAVGDRLTRLAVALGFERAARQVTTLADVLAEHRGERP